MSDTLFARLEELFPEMVACRRDFHMYPELSFMEEETPRKIAAFLSELGLEVRTGVGGKGVVATLKGGRPGKTVALRADFDALPIQDQKQVEYKSRIPGVMHACGHDIHTAALMGVAKVLSEVKNEINGNVVFIYQFAEEQIPGGAKPMIEDGCLMDVDVIYGAHVSSAIPAGIFSTLEGYVHAAGDTFEIEIIGKGGHGASPHLTIDPLMAGGQLVVALQQIVGQRVDPIQPAVISVGTFHAGQAANIIPEIATITGTVRTYDEQVRDFIEKSIGKLASSICEAADAKVNYTYSRGYPALWNHPAETQRIERLAKRIFGEEQVRKYTPSMGMEDFAYYVKEIPGNYFFIGGRNESINAVYPHHHALFDADERSMLDIGKVFIAAVFDYLKQG
ncbi:M20 metallopeptidase family protein [Paenibacillus jiagnxiensis]|uniref:M20 metallopeptidase family protein n=1 Tax=Paenibacillus jiagnxiensis TaxID=3228926 RepID=UPI0033ADFF5C